ncbi:uncharacterized protein LOC135487270 [Lineus longissimus]|uniref:uncharacterized protein LOC135487270 n=1 Tax=Lineus longissimus TaxID=88925 RepID=UPI002B4C8A7C
MATEQEESAGPKSYPFCGWFRDLDINKQCIVEVPPFNKAYYPEEVTFSNSKGVSSCKFSEGVSVDREWHEENILQEVKEVCPNFPSSTADHSTLTRLLTEGDYRLDVQRSIIKAFGDPKPSGTAEERLHYYLQELFVSNGGNASAKNMLQEVFNPLLGDLVQRIPLPTSPECSRYFFRDKWTDYSEVQLSPGSSTFEPDVDEKKPKLVVPDLIIFHPHQPRFCLNVEVGSDKATVSDAIHQCFQQMMTQMHFQDVHFGLVIYPTEWSLIFVSKPGQKIFRMKKSLFSNRCRILDVESFISMVRWTECILKWHTQAVSAQ